MNFCRLALVFFSPIAGPMMKPSRHIVTCQSTIRPRHSSVTHNCGTGGENNRTLLVLAPKRIFDLLLAVLPRRVPSL